MLPTGQADSGFDRFYVVFVFVFVLKAQLGPTYAKKGMGERGVRQLCRQRKCRNKVKERKYRAHQEKVRGLVWLKQEGRDRAGETERKGEASTLDAQKNR